MLPRQHFPLAASGRRGAAARAGAGRGLAMVLLLAFAAPSSPAVAHDGGWPNATAPSDPDALDEVRMRIEGAKGQAVVVFDLDHTLYDNRPRTLQILIEFAASLPPEQSEVAGRIANLRVDDVHYKLAETLGHAGVSDQATVQAATTFWAERFFTDEYVRYDVPIPGAVRYVQDLHARGAFVVYMTGRAAPQFLVGTTASLRRWGFPIGTPYTQLITKPDPKTDDLTFKAAAFAQIDRLGRVVAAFENEPGNLAAMAEHWRESVPVFLLTDFNPEHVGEKLPERARKVRDYTSAASVAESEDRG